jgi:shikimate kinase
MARILVTGMSGTGKTSVLDELGRRGRLTLDTDYDGWVLSDGTWDEPRMSRFLADHDEVIIAGTVDNQAAFYDRFDHVVLFSAPFDVISERVASRSNNPYGSSSRERKEIEANLKKFEPLLRNGATVELDARLPVAKLADELDRLAGG